MTLGHRPVVIGGERVGDLVSLGQKVVFYTTVPALAHLDGKMFDGFAEAEVQIQIAIMPDMAA